MAGNADGSANPPSDGNANNDETPQQMKNWWAGFKKKSQIKKVNDSAPQTLTQPQQRGKGIFGIPLAESIRYANVAISLLDDHGKSYVYGYIPIIVAKCGVYLKDKATETEGIFRLSGSAKRIKELQDMFDSPELYGKALDWAGYNVHDAANVFRRYLNSLPEPVVPLDSYESFRDPLRGVAKENQTTTNNNDPVKDATPPAAQVDAAAADNAHSESKSSIDKAATIRRYQQLITELPALNRQLLLYILDLLAVFASKAEVNRMTPANLSAIFQPGMLSHPTHNLAVDEYRLSQDVVIFLIDNQDHFLVGMDGTAADEQTVKDVQSGPPKTTTLDRSDSSASAAAENVRRYGSLRRNVSTSSRHSRQSSQTPGNTTPAVMTPSGNASPGLGRSNTVPSRRSPINSSSRLNRLAPPSSPPLSPSIGEEEGFGGGDGDGASTPRVQTFGAAALPSQDRAGNTRDLGLSIPVTKELPAEIKNLIVPTLSKDAAERSRSPQKGARALGSLFALGNESGDQRTSRKLQKKRIPNSAQPSAQSSTHSLTQRSGSYQQPVLPPVAPYASLSGSISSEAFPDMHADMESTDQETGDEDGQPRPELLGSKKHSERTLKGALNQADQPVQSQFNQSTTDLSEDAENLGEHNTEDQPKEKRSRWRFSSSKSRAPVVSASVSSSRTSRTGSAAGQESQHNWGGRSRKSMEGGFQTHPGMSQQSLQLTDEGGDEDEPGSRKGGALSWIKQKLDRAKSPPRDKGEHAEKAASKQSLAAIANDLTIPEETSNEKVINSTSAPIETTNLPADKEVPNRSSSLQATEPVTIPHHVSGATAEELPNIKNLSITTEAMSGSSGSDPTLEKKD